MEGRRGYSIAELLVILAIIAITASVSMSFASSIRRRLVVRAVAAELRSTLDQARRLAIAHNRHVGVRFRVIATGWITEMYEDGDGDGIRTDDILARRDRAIRAARTIFSDARGAVALPPYPLIDPVSGELLKGTSPVRFGASGICSFSPRGEASSGSVYMTDGTDTMVLRVYGGTGHIRHLHFDRAARKWRP